VDPEHGTRRVVTDHLGTPRLLCDRCAERVAYHELWPYGEDAPGSTDDGLRIRFTGHERDLNLPTKTTDDLDYMHARYYNFWTGRFLSVDPVQSGWSRYAYVSGNPINATDPDGRAENLLLGPRDLPVHIASVDSVETAWDAFFSSVPPSPVAFGSQDRYAMVINGGGGYFVVRENPGASEDPTVLEVVGQKLGVGRRALGNYRDLVVAAARLYRVDPTLVAAILVKENDAGCYDALPRRLGFKIKSIRPMNINVEVWGRFIPSSDPRRWLADPWHNISFGARILAGIDAHVPPGVRGISRVRIVATLYNRMYARRVTDYGARVGRIWLELGGPLWP